MKHPLFLLLLCFFTLTSSLYAQTDTCRVDTFAQANYQNGSVFSQRLEIFSYPDDTTILVDLMSPLLGSYTKTGQRTTYLNERGQQTYSLTEELDGTVYKPIVEEISTYDSLGRRVFFLKSIYDAITRTLQPHQRTIFTYQGTEKRGSYVLEFWDPNSQQWELNNQVTRRYENGLEVMGETIIGVAAGGIDGSRVIIAYTSDDKIDTLRRQRYTGDRMPLPGEWQTFSISVYSYDAQNDNYEIIEYDPDNSDSTILEIDQKQEFYFSQGGMEEEIRTYNYPAATATFVLAGVDTITYQPHPLGGDKLMTSSIEWAYSPYTSIPPVPISQLLQSYNGFGDLASQESRRYDSGTGQLEPHFLNEVEHNPSGYPTLQRRLRWDKSSMDWRPESITTTSYLCEPLEKGQSNGGSPMIRISPNPTAGSVTVSAPDFPGKTTTFILADLKGRALIREEIVWPSNGIQSMDLPAGLPGGIYLIMLQSDKQIATQKLIFR